MPFNPYYLPRGRRLFVCILLCLFFTLSFPPVIIAQSNDTFRCSTSQGHIDRLKADPIYQRDFLQSEERLLRSLGNNGDESSSRNLNSCREVLRIPVVVHIMHLPGDVPDNQGSNLSDDRIRNGIQMLNDAFANRNAYQGGPFYSNAGVQSEDAQIEFVLASRTPEGQSTSGINRVATGLSNLFRYDACGSGTEDDCLKALSNWDPTQYVNIWLVNEICEDRANYPGNCWLGGYAFYAGAHGRSFDGIVCEARFFGQNSNDHKLMVHEMGHYLNLFHTFEGGCKNDNCLTDGDRVCDTPPDLNGTDLASCNSSLPEFRVMNSCDTDADDPSENNPFTSDREDVYESFMDYGYNTCQNTFTPGQIDRMRRSLLGIRSSLLDSEGAFPVNSSIDAGIVGLLSPIELACNGQIQPRIEVKNYGTDQIQSLEIELELNGQIVGNFNWQGQLSQGQSQTVLLNQVSLPGNDDYQLSISIVAVNGSSADTHKANDVVCGFFRYSNIAQVETLPYCTDASEGIPNDWKSVNDNLGTSLWEAANLPLTCPDLGTASIRLNTWDNNQIENSGEDYLYLPAIDLTNYTAASLNFRYAYKRSFSPLSIRIEASADCGQNFQAIWQKSDINLATSPGFEYNDRWFPQSCNDWASEIISLADFSSDELVIRFAVNYTSTSKYAQPFYLDDVCVDGIADATPSCILPTSIPSSPGTYTANQSCTNNGWTHFWWESPDGASNDLLLLSIQENNAMELSPSDVKVVLTDRYGQGGHDVSNAPYVQNPNGWYVMGRYFDVTPSVQPDANVGVRFYYTDSDFADMQLAVEGSGSGNTLSEHQSLAFYKINELDPNPVNGHLNIPLENYIQFFAGENASLNTWKYAQYNEFHVSEFEVNSFSGGGGGISGNGDGFGAFPVVWLGFEGERTQDGILLQWETALEDNNKLFEIERKSYGADKFVKAGEINGKGFPGKYRFQDPNPPIGPNIYRLKQVDFNGSFAYSDQIEVFWINSNDFAVYPNPGTSNLNIQTLFEGPYAFRLMDITGRKVLEQTGRIPRKSSIRIDTDGLQGGSYIYEFEYGSKLIRGKWIKNP